MTRVRDTLHGNGCTFMIISRSILLTMRNVAGKFVEKIRTHILCLITFFFFGNRTVYEIMLKYVLDPDIRPHILHAGYLRLQTQTQNMKHLLLSHSKNGFANAPQCYVYTYIAFLVYNWRRNECVSWGDPCFSVIMSRVVTEAVNVLRCSFCNSFVQYETHMTGER